MRAQLRCQVVTFLMRAFGSSNQIAALCLQIKHAGIPGSTGHADCVPQHSGTRDGAFPGEADAAAVPEALRAKAGGALGSGGRAAG